MKDYQKLIKGLSEQLYFPRVYLKLLNGKHSAAYFLSQVIYWESKMGREFYRVQEDWEEDGFKEHSLRGAITACERYVKVEKKGLPAKNYYSVRWEELYKDIECATSDPINRATGDDQTAPHTIQDITQETGELRNSQVGDFSSFKQILKDATLSPITESGDSVRLKKPPKYTVAQIREVFDLFGSECYRMYHANTTERKAIETMLDTKGLDKIKNAMGFVKANSGKPHFPLITKPYDLWMKWAKLQDAGQRKKKI